MKVAALFVDRRGPYWDREDIDAWDIERDARKYDGPWPVVAHPPCQRWGRYWSGGPSANVRRELGDDGGCFEAALNAVRKWGGVLEHPEASHAFKMWSLTIPPRGGGWVIDELECSRGFNAWTCCAEQGHYGHPARKATWLYYVERTPDSLRGQLGRANISPPPPPPLIWGPSRGIRLDEGFHSKAERDAARAAGRKPIKRLSTVQNIVTPAAFAEILINLARRSRAHTEAA